MNRIIFPVLFLSLILGVSSARSQTPNYYGALLYSMHVDTSIPPLYPGQPSQITTAYLWLDDLMRLDPEYRIEAYISSLTWNDTAKTIASYLYQIQDDNPLSYYNWDDAGIYPHVYKGAPGQSEFAFIKQAWSLGGTRPGALLSSEIIADIVVSDTFCRTDPTAVSAKDAVLVTCAINDEIKGKWIPSCPDIYRSRKKGGVPLNDTTRPTPVIPDSAIAGTCLQFEYSPEWKKNAGDDLSPNIGWWVKPGQEYIVFLNFVGIAYKYPLSYFSTYPVSFGHSDGMYPVVGGIVQDPNDDFHFGSTHLTVTQWKAALRDRINTLVHP